MAYNQKLADRVREIIAETHDNVEEKSMFGGRCFMVNDKMCVGVEKERLMVRLDPAKYEEVMEFNFEAAGAKKKQPMQRMDLAARSR